MQDNDEVQSNEEQPIVDVETTAEVVEIQAQSDDDVEDTDVSDDVYEDVAVTTAIESMSFGDNEPDTGVVLETNITHPDGKVEEVLVTLPPTDDWAAPTVVQTENHTIQ